MGKKRNNIIFTFITIILLMIIGIWIFKVMNDEIPYVDQWTRGIVPKVADTPLYTMFRWVTELGSQSFVIPFTVVMIVLFAIVFRDWLPPTVFGLGVLGSHILNTLIKRLVARERPSISALLNAEGHSFPSGHAMVSMVCYGLIAFLLVKKLKNTTIALYVQFVFALLIFLIGISRFFINVHYLTDIVTGFVLGYLCLVTIVYFYGKIEQKRSQSQD